jgi:hypothetical protein
MTVPVVLVKFVTLVAWRQTGHGPLQDGSGRLTKLIARC